MNLEREILHKQISFLSVKEISETGEFAGYGSVFENIDDGGDVVHRGAFETSIAEFKASGNMPPVLWSHSPQEPIGVYTDLKEDDRGLYVEGKLAIKTTKGRDIYELAKMGAVKGLSIGYSIREGGAFFDKGIRHLTNLELWETSFVTFPMNPKAQISAVKNAPMTEREFEKLLREAGFSKTQAMGIIASGFKSLKLRDSAEDEKEKSAAEVLQLLKSLNQKLRG